MTPLSPVTDRLEPCPFCDSTEVSLSYCTNVDNVVSGRFVECENCAACGPVDDRCREKVAAALWNAHNARDLSGGEVDAVAWAINAAFNGLSIGMPLTQDEAFTLATAALSAMSRDDAGVVTRLAGMLRKARPYVEQAGFRHHDVSGLLREIDEALSAVGGEGSAAG